jgi:hypothetical protein
MLPGAGGGGARTRRALVTPGAVTDYLIDVFPFGHLT